MILIEEISRDWKRDGDWRIAPAGLAWIAEGRRIIVGDYTRIGNYTHIGNYTRIGSHTNIGNYTRIGSDASIGEWRLFSRSVSLNVPPLFWSSGVPTCSACTCAGV